MCLANLFSILPKNTSTVNGDTTKVQDLGDLISRPAKWGGFIFILSTPSAPPPPFLLPFPSYVFQKKIEQSLLILLLSL